ncbi:MAG: DUF3368 domain-containing protein [Verrucomicrobia bacterium]|nr:DUF3368 domain-containing protein [Verrucomicrobiota bacterium]
MPAVIVDSSVLITRAASEQFHLLREFYSTIHIPPEVWNETTHTPKNFGVQEVRQAKAEGWLVVQSPRDLNAVQALPFNLQPGETEALALELSGSLLLVDDAQGRRAAAFLGIAYTGTLGVLLRAKAEGKIPALRPLLELLGTRTTFWLSPTVQAAALKQAGEG